jgi:hypothetical protein
MTIYNVKIEGNKSHQTQLLRNNFFISDKYFNAYRSERGSYILNLNKNTYNIDIESNTIKVLLNREFKYKVVDGYLYLTSVLLDRKNKLFKVINNSIK